MTEYDFSPEAYQQHLANMSRISHWVDRTERHRPEFQDASVLLDSSSLPPLYSPDDPPRGKLRKRPPPLPLHLPPHPQYLYPSPPFSANFDFSYAPGPFSPGPMPYPPPLMSAPPPPPGHMYPQLPFSPPTSPRRRHHHSHHSHGRSSRRSSRSRSSSFSFAPVTSIGMGYYPYTGIHPGAAPPPLAYASGPPVVVLPPSHAHHGFRNGASYMVSF